MIAIAEIIEPSMAAGVNWVSTQTSYYVLGYVMIIICNYVIDLISMWVQHIYHCKKGQRRAFVAS